MATVAELRAQLADYGIETTSKMRKPQLEKMVSDFYLARNKTTPPMNYFKRIDNYRAQNAARGSEALTVAQLRQIRKASKRELYR